MPLPQKALEQLAREPSRTPGWSGRLLMFSSTIFFVISFVYVGLAYGYKPYLDSQVKTLDDQIKNFANQISDEDRTSIVEFYSQLVNLKKLLANHVLASQGLEWLGANTASNVYYGRASLSPANHQVSVSGLAKSVSDVSSQVLLLQNAENVDRVNFSNVSLGQAGLWQFDATVYVRPDLFRLSPPQHENASSTENATSTP